MIAFLSKTLSPEVAYAAGTIPASEFLSPRIGWEHQSAELNLWFCSQLMSLHRCQNAELEESGVEILIECVSFSTDASSKFIHNIVCV